MEDIFSNLSPIFKGLGFVNFVANACVGLYYNMIIAWTIYYFFASFTPACPWQFCDNDYNDEKCFSFSGFKECEELRLNRTAENITNNIIYLNRSFYITTKVGVIFTKHFVIPGPV